MYQIMRTDRLLRRRLEPSDVDNLRSLHRDAQVMRYIDNESWDRDRIEVEVLPHYWPSTSDTSGTATGPPRHTTAPSLGGLPSTQV